MIVAKHEWPDRDCGMLRRLVVEVWKSARRKWCQSVEMAIHKTPGSCRSLVLEMLSALIQEKRPFSKNAEKAAKLAGVKMVCQIGGSFQEDMNLTERAGWKLYWQGRNLFQSECIRKDIKGGRVNIRASHSNKPSCPNQAGLEFW